jgi:site-specific recombinase XerD
LRKGSRERTVFVSNLDLQKRLALACGLMPVAEPGIRPRFKSRRGIRRTPLAYRLRLHQLRLSSGLSVRVPPHYLRDTAATLLIEAGVDILFVQRLRGHAIIATTEIYTRVVDISPRKALLSADAMRRFSDNSELSLVVDDRCGPDIWSLGKYWFEKRRDLPMPASTGWCS